MLAQIAYMSLLQASYQRGEMSVAYPIARTAPIPMVFYFEMLIRPSIQHHNIYVVGIVMICLGVLVTSQPKIRKGGMSALGLPLLTALAISIYSITDHHLLHVIGHSSSHSPVVVCAVYLLIIEVGLFAGLGLPVLFSASYRAMVSSSFAEDKKQAFYMAVGMTGSYLLALLAMSLTEQISLIVTLRQLSIPIGFLLAIFILKEQKDPRKWLGMLAICGGMILVGAY